MIRIKTRRPPPIYMSSPFALSAADCIPAAHSNYTRIDRSRALPGIANTPNPYRREMRGRTRGWIRLFEAGHSIDEIAAVTATSGLGGVRHGGSLRLGARPILRRDVSTRLSAGKAWS